MLVNQKIAKVHIQTKLKFVMYGDKTIYAYSGNKECGAILCFFDICKIYSAGRYLINACNCFTLIVKQKSL